jgi:hypothetical protein
VPRTNELSKTATPLAVDARTLAQLPPMIRSDGPDGVFPTHSGSPADSDDALAAVPCRGLAQHGQAERMAGHLAAESESHSRGRMGITGGEHV